MRKGYKYRGGVGTFNEKNESFFERDLKTLIDNQIYVPIKDELNDPTETYFDDADFLRFLDENNKHSSEVRSVYNNLKSSIVSKNGIYSLSNSFKSELLWAYYADGHHGFCIEYDIDVIRSGFNYNRYVMLSHLIEVDYLPNVPIVNRLNFSTLVNDKSRLLNIMVGSKSISWKHEDEVRLIFENSGLLEIDYRAVTAIYFGCRMGQNERERIMSALKGRGIKYFEMEFVNQGYHLIEKPIEDKYKNAAKYLVSNLNYDERFVTEEYMGKMYIHKSNLIKALEIVKHEPLITEIYQATVTGDFNNPEFKVFAYTKNDIAPIKTFTYRLEDLS
jgi:hypothetical protein